MYRSNSRCYMIDKVKVKSVLLVLTTIYKRVKRQKGVDGNKRTNERIEYR